MPRPDRFPGVINRARGGVARLCAICLLACTALPAAAQSQVDVVVHSAQMTDFPFRLEALGTAHANESVQITSRISQVITAIRFEEGQHVRRGDVLVELENSELAANLAEARAALVDSRSQYQRGKDLSGKKVISESDLQQLEAKMEADRARVQAAEARLAETVIRAPFDGTVGLRRVSMGALVTPGTVITTLDDLDTIKLDFDVPETHLAPLHPGLEISARSVAFPDRTFTGRVATIDTRVDPVSRSVTVRAQVPNPDRILKPGMFLNVDVIREQQRSLVVPEQAIVPEKSEQFVFVVEGENRVQKRRVRIGRRRPGEIEILDGLHEGEQVIIEGTQKVDDGTEVHVIKQGV